MKDRKTIEREVAPLAEKLAGEMGFEVVEVAFKNGKEPSLTVYLDKPGGIELDDLEKYHLALDPALDELDPTEGHPYTLNVSSPGLDRPFTTPRDFERHMGEKVEVKLYAPMRGKKTLEGVLVGYDGATATLRTGGGELRLELNKVAKMTVAIDFD